MELNSEDKHNTITNYTEDTITINNKTINFPCFVSNNHIQLNANIDDIAGLINNAKIEILIIGTKNNIDVKQQFAIKKIINCEFMAIKSSIYSFNILISDMRNAGLLIV